MYPGPFEIFGSLWATWNLVFLAAALVGFFVWNRAYVSFPGAKRPSFLAARYVAIVYLCALAAQWFAYLVDSNTTFLPHEGASVLHYYLNPLSGPKTLYGAFLALPLVVRVALAPARSGLATALDTATPAVMTIFGMARVGCFLQGCCYGLHSPRFGLAFPVGSNVHGEQVLAGLVRFDQASLPMLPTQLPSAFACFLLAIWSFRRLRLGYSSVFIHTLLGYSAFRFTIEFFRADPARNHMWVLSTSQWIALLVMASFATSKSWRTSPSRPEAAETR